MTTTIQPTKAPAAASRESAGKKTYVISGAGNRAHAWLSQMTSNYSEEVEVVGICDTRIERARDMVETYGFQVEAFEDFDAMLERTTPDRAIIIVPERYHAGQIVSALDKGCEVVTEKPLCVSLEQCEAILAAERRNGKPIYMGFNYRLIPLCSKVREIVLSGEIGVPVSMDFTYYLSHRGHGVSYFRRWHRLMEMSGGLLVTKGTHHFDLANWWMNDHPQRVFAMGRRNFFGPGKNPYQGERCSTCDHQEECDWFTPANLKEPDYELLSQELGYRVRGVKGYERDYCPFGDEVDIYDTMSVMVEYAGGAQLNYSLCAGSPYEGWDLAINGTKGRLETKITDAKPDPDGAKQYKILSKDGRRQRPEAFRIVHWPDNYRILLLPHAGETRWIDIPNILEGHGGGDFALYDRVFRGGGGANTLGQYATAEDGAWSVAIGAAANQAIQTGMPVDLPKF